MAALEQRLLGGFSAAVVLAGVLVTLGELPSTGGGETVARSGVLAVMAAIAVLLQARSTWRLSHIRVVEAATFLTLTLFLATTTYRSGVADLDATVAAWTSTLFGFGLLAIAYGVFALNSLRRAAVGVVAISAACPASALLIRASDPAGRPVFDAAASVR